MRYILILALLFSSVFSDDDESYEHRMLESNHLIPLDIRYLNLSDQQTEQLKGLIKTTQKNIKTIKHTLKAFREDAETMFTSDTFDAEAYQQAYLEARKQVAKQESLFLAKLHTILTPKQRAAFAEKIEKWELE